MRSLAVLGTLLAALLLPPRAAGSHEAVEAESAALHIVIDKETQEMSVYRDGVLHQVFRVSTGRRGHRTPSGTFRPLWLTRMAYAPKYDNAPMPYSIFFTRAGHAIHATGHMKTIGLPVSHGCVRLAPEAAEWLYTLVQRIGLRNTTIEII